MEQGKNISDNRNLVLCTTKYGHCHVNFAVILLGFESYWANSHASTASSPHKPKRKKKNRERKPRFGTMRTKGSASEGRVSSELVAVRYLSFGQISCGFVSSIDHSTGFRKPCSQVCHGGGQRRGEAESTSPSMVRSGKGRRATPTTTSHGNRRIGEGAPGDH